MKNLRLFAFTTCSLTLATACLVAACGDDTVVSVDAGSDSGFDAPTSDAPVGTDAGTDAKADAVAPLVDAGLTIEAYKSNVANALCSTLSKCCFGTNGGVPDSGAVDGGTFKTGQCQDIYKRLGFESSNVGQQFAVAGGNVDLDQTKALDCLAKVNGLSCSLGFAELAAARTACFEALTGKQTAGQACKGSMECAPGLFCNPTQADAGAGTCAAVRTAGQSCNVFVTNDVDQDAVQVEEACSWRASGTPPLHCDTFDYAGTGDYRPRADWKCVAGVGLGQPCSQTTWCSGGICDPTDFTCRTPVEYFTTTVCDSLITR